MKKKKKNNEHNSKNIFLQNSAFSSAWAEACFSVINSKEIFLMKNIFSPCATVWRFDIKNVCRCLNLAKLLAKAIVSQVKSQAETNLMLLWHLCCVLALNFARLSLHLTVFSKRFAMLRNSKRALSKLATKLVNLATDKWFTLLATNMKKMPHEPCSIFVWSFSQATSSRQSFLLFVAAQRLQNSAKFSAQ